MEQVYIVIPAFCPDRELCRRVEEIRLTVPSEIVIVDDGSGEEFIGIFRQLRESDGCTVLSHDKNRGKGAALKTAFQYIKEKEETGNKILCIDCDGQHLPEDGRKLLTRLGEHPEALILGGRDFSDRHIPWRSRVGNRVSSRLFKAFAGVGLEDTQTGFRAFGSRLLEMMLRVPGQRYEYEMRVLIACARKGIPILTETIDTIYIDDNEGSHFRPIRDSFRVTAAFFLEPGRFAASSIFCAVLDLGLFRILEGAPGDFAGIAAATILARCVSASVNFLLNRNWVFGIRGERKRGRSFLRYFILCSGIALASALLVSAVSGISGADPVLAKIPCDLVLFLISYMMQKKWVFPHRREDGGADE